MEQINTVKEYVKEIKHYDKKNIYIYGAGKVGKIIYKICCDNKINIKAFCVTDINGNVETINNVPVVQFDGISDNNAVFLMAFIEHGEKRISEKLKENNDNIFIEMPNNILMIDDYEKKRRIRPTMEITPKIGCVVNCRYCPQRNFIDAYYKDNTKRNSNMTLEQFKICLNKLPKDTLIEFAGFVEPFLNKESIDMMYYANEKGYDMTLFTTLVGLNKNDLERIIRLPFKQVVLHTADKDGFANIPVTKEYLELLKIITNTHKKDGSMFVDEANCQSKPHEKVLEITKGKFKIYCEMSDRAGNLDNKDNNLTMADVHGKLYCTRSVNINHNVLLPDGTVVLCCNDFGMKHVLGNLLTQSYENIINGQAINEIKKAMNLECNIDIICRKCMFAKVR